MTDEVLVLLADEVLEVVASFEEALFVGVAVTEVTIPELVTVDFSCALLSVSVEGTVDVIPVVTTPALEDVVIMIVLGAVLVLLTCVVLVTLAAPAT